MYTNSVIKNQSMTLEQGASKRAELGQVIAGHRE